MIQTCFVSSLQKVVEMLSEVVVGCWEVRWIWWMRQKFLAQFIQLLKRWLRVLQSGVVVEKDWALPLDQCRLQALRFSVHLINLLNRCHGFSGIKKVVVDQRGSRPANSDHDLSLVQVWLWEVLWSFFSVQPLGWSLCTIHFSSHITIQ